MCSLHGFPALPPVGHISLCEVEGRVHSMPVEQADVLIFTNTVASHPHIAITRDLLHSSICREDTRRVFLPVSETLFKKLINMWYEQGLVAALHLAAEPQDGKEVPVALQFIAAYMLRVVSGINHLLNSFHPHLRESGDKLIAAVSQTRTWPVSPVRCLAWHPHCTKLAVAAWDDSVRVYSPGTSLTPILKCKSQHAVSCMAWRPMSASELAVGCEGGVLVWQVDPNSVVTRPSMSCVTILHKPHHSPVTSVTWSPQGDVLLTASAADTAMYVWDVEMEKFVALRRVGGGGVSLVTCSPDGSKVFAATTGIIFRVWGTDRWLPERWTVVSGHVQTACWSPCGSMLLFATSEEPLIYSLTFSKLETVFQGDNASRSALPVVDLTEVEVSEGERVGGIIVSLMWDTKGQHLAVLFKKTDLIAVFLTELHGVLHVAPCCLVQGVSGEIPNCISFQQNFEEGACLTIIGCPAALKHVRCSREDFVPYFLNFLREQTSRILQLSSFPTPSKAHRTLQKRKGNGKSRLVLFPPNQHDNAGISMGIKSLEITDVLCSETEEGSNRKNTDVMKKKMIAVSPGGDFGRPIAQSSPLKDYRHSNHDTLQRSFSLQDFIVKGARSGRKKCIGAQEQVFPSSSGKESKSRKRINPTRLGTGKSRGGDVCFGLASRSCEPSAPFCEQPIETSNNKNFEEERTLLRKERLRQRCDNKRITLSPTKVVVSHINDFIVADPSLVSCSEQLQVLADMYSRLMNCNLVLNIMAELWFVVDLLVVQVPVGCKADELHLSEVEGNENAINFDHGKWNTKKCALFSTVHNCVYFAMLVLNRQRQILECFDKITLKMLADNRHTLTFMPDLYEFISGLLTTDMSKTRRYASLVAANQGNVSFQSDTDSRQNFPTDQAFHVFRKQRDGFYEILRIWEADHMLPDWSFAIALGPRVRTLLSLHNEPANFVHFARLFRSQLLGTCNGYSSCNEPETFSNCGGGSIDILKEVHPEKLSRLHERLVTPIQSGGYCPLPSFPGQQEFYHDFILHSSHPTFLQHLADSLASEILVLNETSFVASDLEDTDTSVDDITRTSYLTCVLALCLLAKFLGLVTFMPYQSRVKVLPENMVASHSAVRAKLCPQLDVLVCMKEAVQAHKLVLTIPWVVKYLSMMDPVSAHLPYYRAVFEQLFCLYRGMQLPGRPSLLIRLLLGWLFESSNFLEGLFYTWKQDLSINNTSEPGDPTRVVPLDGLDVVDEHCLYLCCPFLGELKLCLSVGMGSSCRTVKHITPNSASLNKPSAAKQIQLLLEESFFHGQPVSTRKTVEYIAERVASCCVKHICNKLLLSVKQQGAADVAQLISASSIVDTMNSESETAIKQLKESLLREVASIANRCCGDFRLHCDVRQYCKHRCKLAMPVLLADDVLEPVCTMCAHIAARFSQERVNTWIQSHITPGLFLKDFQLDIEKAFRNVGKLDYKNESVCMSSHVVPSGGRSVKHLDVIESPAQAIMRVQRMMWGLLDGDDCVISEQQVLVTLNAVQSALSNRADLIPSAERLLPSLVLDLALLLVAHHPDMMTTGLMKHFVNVWHTCEEYSILAHFLCPRNVLLLSQSKHAADKVWTCLAGFLVHLLSCDVLQPNSLEQQCVALLRSTWPQGIMNLIALCIREVMRLYSASKDYKFTLLMEWLSEMCDDIAFFD